MISHVNDYALSKHLSNATWLVKYIQNCIKHLLIGHYFAAVSFFSASYYVGVKSEC